MNAMTESDEEEFKKTRVDLEEIIGKTTEVWRRQARALEVRHNLWDNQSEDGRRHSHDGEITMPFEGASDARIPLVDVIINDKVAGSMHSFWRAEVQAKPIKPGDVAKTTSVSNLLSWVRNVPMKEELIAEVELSAQYMFGDDPGVAVVAIDWLQDTKLVRTPVSFEEMAAMYATGAATPQEADPEQMEPEMLADFIDVMTNKDREREALAWIASAFPSVTGSARRKMLRELRKTGAADVPLPSVRENRPTVVTLRFGEDVFFPVGTADVQRARNIHRREWCSAEELRERVATMGWGDDTVEEVIKKGRGQTIVNGVMSPRRLSVLTDIEISGPGRVVDETTNLYEIWWSYERRADELGIMGIYVVAWNIAVKDSWLWAGLSDLPHGKYPFVIRGRERLGRQVTDSRGMSRPLLTHQQEIKVQRDARSNNTQMLASPPMRRKMMAGAAQLVLGPNAEVPVMKPDDFDLITMPQLTNASMEMEKTTREEAYHYAGVLTPEADQNRVFMLSQTEADKFNGLWGAVFEQVLELCQKFYSPEELELITGANGELLGIEPDDIQGQWHVALEIDQRDLNMDFVMKKLDGYGKVLSLDSQGVLDRSQMPIWGATALFPGMASRLIQPMQKVTQKIIDEEQGNVAKMAVGIEPAMSEDGIDAPQTRLQAMQATLGNSPRLAMQYHGDPEFRALLENRQKYLTQQLVQEQNKVVGRLGTMPLQGNGQPTGAPAPAAGAV